MLAQTLRSGRILIEPGPSRAGPQQDLGNHNQEEKLLARLCGVLHFLPKRFANTMMFVFC